MNTYENPTKPVGYSALIEQFRLSVIPNWHTSLVAPTNLHKIDFINGIVEETFPNRYMPDNTVGKQLEFALKYDGTNLAILSCLFRVIAPPEIETYIRTSINGKYARRIWFFYEMLTGNKLNLDDLHGGGYIDALDSSKYYTLNKGVLVKRQRIHNNLPGAEQFCPLVRRTQHLKEFESFDLPRQYANLITAYTPQQIRRAMDYLYNKETKSSFAIEHEQPSSSRVERFVFLLQSAGLKDYCTKQTLVELQNKIVEPRHCDSDYRNNQNYVGTSIDWRNEQVHYIPPRPEILDDLMSGLLNVHIRMSNSNIHAIVHAAIISFGFVYLHPFEDGNGRIHRFLLHHILLCRGFTPPNTIFPISASMLKHKDKYDAVLESFSKPLMRLLDYKIDESGRLTLTNDNLEQMDCWYRYMDLTLPTEMLADLIRQTATMDVLRELQFIVRYDKARHLIQNIADMPNKKIDLCIRLCLQNKGRLSLGKRSAYFDLLTDNEILDIEAAISESFGEHFLTIIASELFADNP